MREMRRSRQALTPEECAGVLERGTSGVLAVAGDEGYPYAVPLSYAWRNGRVLFHCAVTGHKLDAIRRDSRASFCVVDQDEVVPKQYTTRYRSVIVFGRARVLDNPVEKLDAIRTLAEKYRPGHEEEHQAEINSAWDRLVMVELAAERITGKQSRALAEGQ